MSKYYCPYCETQLHYVYDGCGMACPTHGIIYEDFYQSEWDIAFRKLCKEYYRIKGMDYENAEFNESGCPEVPEWICKSAYQWKQDYKRIMKEEPDYNKTPIEYYIMRYHNLLI